MEFVSGNDMGKMVVEAEVVCPQSVPVLDVQYISSSQAVSFLFLIGFIFGFFGLRIGNWLVGMLEFWI